jgi:hypothetical protein
MQSSLEVTCPACGALVEGQGGPDLVTRAREHTLDAHRYEIPPEHVLEAALPAGTRVTGSPCAAAELRDPLMGGDRG